MADRKNLAVKFETAIKLEQYIQAHPLKPKIIHIVDAALEEYYKNHPIKGETNATGDKNPLS